ncbi:MAG: SMC family ATPase [Chloroflexi bacterium]|nr:SMC family ATPase [Chloroflexota bacterium]
MIPVYLRLSGFLSYKDPVELDFSGFDLACISGANGAGKSSLLDAITWALFGQARRRDDALINAHCNTAEVIFDFRYEGNLYRVQRSKPSGKTGLLEFFIRDGEQGWRPLTEHSLRETEAHIQRTLRMDYETFTNASFFLQGKADQFAQQRPGDRKRILTSILGLEMWETFRERAAERRRNLENDQAVLAGWLNEIDEELKEEEQRRTRLKELQDDLSRWANLRQAKEAGLTTLRSQAAALETQWQYVEMLQRQNQAVEQKIEAQQKALAERQAERQQYQQQLAAEKEINAAYQRWQAARAELEQWEQLSANFHQYELQRSEPLLKIERERSRLEQEQRSLEEQLAKMVELQASLPGLEGEIVAALKALEEANARLEQRLALEAEQQSLLDTRAELQAENKRMRDAMRELKERIDELNQVSGADCPLCGQPLSPEERSRLVLSLEAQGREMGDRYRQNLENLRQHEERYQMVERGIEELRQVESELRQQQRQVDQLEDRRQQIQAQWAEWQAGGAARMQTLERILKEEDYALDVRAELARINEALKDLGYDAAAHDAARRAEQEGRASEEAYRQLEAARSALSPLEREIAGLEAQLAEDQKQAGAQLQAYHQALERYEQDKANLPDLRQAEDEMFGIKEQEDRLRMQVGGALQAVEVLKTQKERREDLLGRQEEYQRQVAQLKVLERAFGKDGVPALLIEQALPEIEAQANEILDRLARGGMSVRFATQKDYKDKNREDKKETLDILISDSAGMREYEMFSGGEAFRVNFAIRLALSRVLAQRAGARLQTLVIDEGFGSQDAEGRQRLIEAINLVRPDFAKVLVITHLEELKDVFPARIEVEKGLQGSSLRVTI